MTQPLHAAICIVAEGDSLDTYCRCLDCILAHSPRDRIELRCASGGAKHSLDYAIGTLCADRCWPWRQQLPEGFQRYDVDTEDGLRLRAWYAPERVGRGKLLWQMFHDVPLRAEYVVWLDQSTVVEAGWWDALARHFADGVDWIGRRDWHEYRPGEAERACAEPWHLGVPPEKKDGKPGVSFPREGLIALRSERIREARFPPRRHEGRLDVLLGAIGRQMGWSYRDIGVGHDEARTESDADNVAAL